MATQPEQKPVATFEALGSWANLVAAARQARRGKRTHPDVAAFHLELEPNLLRLQEELRTRTYEPGPYRAFYVCEPKKRLISAAPYRDRVVHHALINVIGPVFERNFIRDSYANQLGKGTHRAVERYHQYARRFRYVLQCDIVKFFPSLDHEILKRLLRSRVRDDGLLWLAELIINASNPQEPVTAWFAEDDLLTPLARRRGLPIGNLTSQFWANVYLHGLDNFIKRGRRCPGYIRYVDDFVVFGNDKAGLHELRQAVGTFLAGLRLRIHHGKTQVQPTARPVRFLGYRCWPTHRFLVRENIRRFRRRARWLQQQYAQGELDWPQIKARLQAWDAHAATADSYRLRWRIFSGLPFVRVTMA